MKFATFTALKLLIVYLCHLAGCSVRFGGFGHCAILLGGAEKSLIRRSTVRSAASAFRSLALIRASKMTTGRNTWPDGRGLVRWAAAGVSNTRAKQRNDLVNGLQSAPRVPWRDLSSRFSTCEGVAELSMTATSPCQAPAPSRDGVEEWEASCRPNPSASDRRRSWHNARTATLHPCER
jgi:hypothetical protein